MAIRGRSLNNYFSCARRYYPALSFRPVFQKLLQNKPKISFRFRQMTAEMERVGTEKSNKVNWKHVKVSIIFVIKISFDGSFESTPSLLWSHLTRFVYIGLAYPSHEFLPRHFCFAQFQICCVLDAAFVLCLLWSWLNTQIPPCGWPLEWRTSGASCDLDIRGKISCLFPQFFLCVVVKGELGGTFNLGGEKV